MKRSNKIKATLLAATIFASFSVHAAPVLWIGDSSGRLGTVDITTGTANVIGNMGVTMTDIAFDPNGNLWGISFGSLYKINSATGASSLVGNLGLSSANSLVFDSSGTLYTATTSLYSVSTTTGAASLIGSGGGTYTSSGDLAFVGDNLFLSSTGGDRLVNVDTTNGSGSLVGNIGFQAVYGLSSPDHSNLYGVSGFDVLSINSETGVGTYLTNYSNQGLGAAYGSAFLSESYAIPVPAAAFMFAPALIGFAALRRKKHA